MAIGGATVKLHWRPADGSNSWTSNANINNASGGVVEYAPINTDVQNVGLYLLEWEVTFSGGKILTVPQDGYILLRILDDIA